MADGVEGFVGKDTYLSLYTVSDVIGAREAFLRTGAVPWLVVFGTDGAGTAYCYDTRCDPMMILEASFPGLDLDPMCVRGKSFLEFLEYLASSGRE